jgi:hypothetical protein
MVDGVASSLCVTGELPWAVHVVAAAASAYIVAMPFLILPRYPV